MWKFFLWKIGVENLLHSWLWKAVKNPQAPCGKKAVAALSKIPLFHISFLYCC